MTLTFPERTRVIEVGPRDGLQALADTQPTDFKVEMIERLAACGFPCIEAASFVHPRVVPQLADAERVLERVRRRPGVSYRGLVPNRKGAERALSAGVDEMLALVTVSETYCRKNQNMSVEENLAAVSQVFAAAAARDVPVVVAVSTAFFCPYEGAVDPERVLAVIRQLRELGCGRLYLAATAGMADPRRVRDLVGRVKQRWPDLELGLHLHDTNGMALANALAGLDAGADFLEGSVAGLGGGIRLPAGIDAGNVASDDLVHMLECAGVATGVDPGRLRETSLFVSERLGLPPKSHLARHGSRARMLGRSPSRG